MAEVREMIFPDFSLKAERIQSVMFVSKILLKKKKLVELHGLYIFPKHDKLWHWPGFLLKTLFWITQWPVDVKVICKVYESVTVKTLLCLIKGLLNLTVPETRFDCKLLSKQWFSRKPGNICWIIMFRCRFRYGDIGCHPEQHLARGYLKYYQINHNYFIIIYTQKGSLRNVSKFVDTSQNLSYWSDSPPCPRNALVALLSSVLTMQLLSIFLMM